MSVRSVGNYDNIIPFLFKQFLSFFFAPQLGGPPRGEDRSLFLRIGIDLDLFIKL